MVAGGEFQVGRGPDVDWVLPDPDRLLSKRHFALVSLDGVWRITDTSTNGTYLNAEPEAIGRGMTRVLRDGDQLRAGGYEIAVNLVDVPAQRRDTETDNVAAANIPDASRAAQRRLPEPDRNPFDEETDRALFDAGDTSPDLGRANYGGLPSQAASLPPSAGAIPDRVPREEAPPANDPGPVRDGEAGGSFLADDFPSYHEEMTIPPTGGGRGKRSAIPAAAELRDHPVIGDDTATSPPTVAAPEADSSVTLPTETAAPRQMPAAGEAPVVRQHKPRSAIPSQPAPLSAEPAAATEQTPEPSAAPEAPPDGALLSAFLAGAGLADAAPPDPEAMMREAGMAFRAMVSGLRGVLIARAAVKNEFRIEQTLMRAAGNNPLRFSAHDDDALIALLGTRRRADMSSAAAVANALTDIRRHEIAVIAALHVAVRSMMEDINPDKIRAAQEQGGLSVLPSQRKARAWDAYETRHSAIMRALDDDFDSVFGKAFTRAYARAMDEIVLREQS